MKVFVKVRGDFGLDGKFTPLLFRTEDGPVVHIDCVLDVRPAASLRTGGKGVRYLCRVENAQVYLFRDEDVWFLEKILLSEKRKPYLRPQNAVI